MDIGNAVKLGGAALLAAAVVDQVRRPAEERDWQGALAGFIPYDLRPPTPGRFVARWWNPGDPRLFTPQVFGVGWSVNLAELLRRVTSAQTLSGDEPHSP